ncbi:MAG: chromosome partitioning protein ParB [Halobacteriovoraceae bacterium]|nr:chromosome partitioning protein ParB [Halobacteriovoraceae bacterium]|tara:strand:+ start:3432 stop:4334 length:903 start_codon:yes stop_codon:yes gene_type:complete
MAIKNGEKMTTKSKSALGKGMGALLGGTAPQMNKEEKTHDKSSNPLLIPLHKIVANKEQPRKIFKDKELLELSASIKENGVIQPITVKEEEGKFVIIAGERRYRASKLAGLEQIPAIVKRVTKKETLVMALIENIQRSDLNCVEEALAYYQLMNEFELTQEEVAKKLGKDRSSIANHLRVLKLPREVVQLLQKEELSFGHAKILAGLKEPERVKRLAREAVDANLSVRELEALVKKKDKPATPKTNKFFDEKLDALEQKLERKTGFHFDLKSKQNGKGTISIKFNNEAEFNDIFEFLTRK